jgi:small GTP-binding protein
MLKATIQVLLYGLERSGKSTLVSSYLKGEFKSGTPSTAHQSYDIVVNEKTNFTLIEVGGRKEVRRFVEEYLPHVNATIFVIDGSDEGSFPEVRREFLRILNNPITLGKPLAIVFNKVDVSRTHPSVIIDRLDILNRYDRPHRVFSTTCKIPKSFGDVLIWIQECMEEDKFPLEDRVSRLLSIYIFDMLVEKKEGLPLLALLGQLEIISRTGQVEYNRDKILVLLRKLRTRGELEYDDLKQVWKITDKGREKLRNPDLIKGTKYEKLRAILDEEKTGEVLKEQKEVIDEFDIDELAELYKKTTKS